MQKALGFFRQYLDAGCDTLYFMADDYYQDKLPGHCPRCIERFGGLAGEQQFMLHEILNWPSERGFPEDQILFCPTHYDVNAGQDYLNVFNDDAELRKIQYTFTYLDEETIAKRKQEYPHLRYALFYNGPRWLAYYRSGSARARRALAPCSPATLFISRSTSDGTARGTTRKPGGLSTRAKRFDGRSMKSFLARRPTRLSWGISPTTATPSSRGRSSTLFGAITAGTPRSTARNKARSSSAMRCSGPATAGPWHSSTGCSST